MRETAAVPGSDRSFDRTLTRPSLLPEAFWGGEAPRLV